MDQKLFDNSKPDKNDTWKVNVIKKEISIFDPIDKYMY